MRKKQETTWIGNNDKYYIEKREGENKKCEEYCNVAQYCPFYRKLKGLDEGEKENA